ncbi:MAG: hypothetical protein FWD73_10965 [Polyangiaceae bacterium]|nr:hypothetical protein [Polyangiaceae bacterium]
MLVVDFYKLPRAIQDRFVGSVMSGFPPAPLLARKSAVQTKAPWVALSVVSLLALVGTTAIGYGEFHSTLSIHSWRVFFAVYAVLVFGVAFGLVQVWTRRVRERGLPFAAGVYLFPACLIDAQSDCFRIYDTTDASVKAKGSHVRVSFESGSSFSFVVANANDAEATATGVWAARERAMQARASEDPKELVAVDPLHNPRFSSPVGPREPYQVQMPLWKKYGVVAAGIVAIVVAPLLLVSRNRGSDNAMYVRATKANDVASYRLYLEHGRVHTVQVDEYDLPHAELRDAAAAGTVDALIAFRATHPVTKTQSELAAKIQSELAVEIRTAMLAALESARAKGTLAALNEFAHRYPDHGIDRELGEAIHAVYIREFEAFKKAAPSNDKNVVPFIERLFAWAEKHGARVEIRFRRRKSESLGRADAFVSRTPSFAGEVSYPSQYFDEKHSAKREEVLGKILASRFEKGLSEEIFDFLQGAVVPTDVEMLPEVKVPTLFVTHAAEWSGHTYTTQKPRGTYVSIIFPFDAQFVIPGGAKPLKFRSDVFRAAAIGQLKDNNTLRPGSAEEKVYGTMGNEAFDQFGRKFLERFFPDASQTP